MSPQTLWLNDLDVFCESFKVFKAAREATMDASKVPVKSEKKKGVVKTVAKAKAKATKA
jgi:hypothetical protein